MYHLDTTARSLSAALKTLKPAIERKNTIPILGYALFNGNTVTGTDLDIAIDVTIPAVKAEGAACLPFHLLDKLVALIEPETAVAIRVDDAKGGGAASLTFACGSYNLPSLPVEDFPTLTFVKASEITGLGDDFKAALVFAHRAVSKEETRYYLNGVCADASDADGVKRSGIVATDGHRLVCHPVEADLSAIKGAIIPRKVVGIMVKMPSPFAIDVGAENTKLAFRFSGVTITTKLIDGTFPDWRRVVPRKDAATQTIVFDRRELQAAAKRLRAALTSATSMTLAYRDGKALAVAKDAEGMEAIEYLPSATVEHSGTTGSISFNADYVNTALDMLKRHAMVKVRLIDSGSPIYAKGMGKGEEFVVLMPMRGYDDKFVAEVLERRARPALPAPVKEAA